MKTFTAALLTLGIVWSLPAAAEFCRYDNSGKVRSCEFKVTGLKKQSQIVISYTQQGWSLMAVVFVDEFVFVEGDARIEIGKENTQNLEYVTTRRDVVPGGLMEAGVFKVSEELLHDIANSDGGIRIYLPASEGEEQRIKANDSRFSDLEEYIAETKTVLGLDQATDS